ncbi:MAG: restriction endonuclease subunit S, partial [Chloroflexota bacterium]|nr:restriction endonuclease subunit S [Chloroflexota bacterium]
MSKEHRTPADDHAAELPAGWVATTLGEVCLDTPTVRPADYPDKAISYIDIASIDNSSFRVGSAKTHLGRNAPSRARQRVRSGDTLFSTVRTYLRNVAMVPPELDGEVASTGFCVLS